MPTLTRLPRPACVLVCLLALPAFAQEGAPAPEGKGEASLVAEGDELMNKRSVKGYEGAVEKYEEALKGRPDDLDLKLKLATALNAVMRAKTHGNLITIDGTQDTAANKRLWTELGTRSEKLAKEVIAARPESVAAQLQYAEAYMYKSSSFGIVKAIMSGSAGQYQENAETLIKLDEDADGGVGYVYLGGFFLVAPWPMSDDDKSAKNYEKALQIEPKSVRNRYYRGLRAFHDEDWDLAEKHWKYAVENPCTLPSEKDFCAYMKKQAKRGLKKVAEER